MTPVLPRWQCHKIVRAAQIVRLEQVEQGGWRMTVGVLGPRVEDLTALRIEGDWYRKHQPSVGGYYVIYDDGYASYSPAEAFEAGYTRIDSSTAEP